MSGCHPAVSKKWPLMGFLRRDFRFKSTLHFIIRPTWKCSAGTHSCAGAHTPVCFCARSHGAHDHTHTHTLQLLPCTAFPWASWFPRLVLLRNEDFPWRKRCRSERHSSVHHPIRRRSSHHSRSLPAPRACLPAALRGSDCWPWRQRLLCACPLCVCSFRDSSSCCQSRPHPEGTEPGCSTSSPTAAPPTQSPSFRPLKG